MEKLQFDDLPTPDGFGNMTAPYKGLVFNGFFAFNPSHPKLKGIISVDDLNCAVSKPNALYGTRDNLNRQSLERPSIQSRSSFETFTIHSLQIKPLDMPLGFVSVDLYGQRHNESDSSLRWSVDFPAGFHDVLDVRLEEFSKRPWEGLQRLDVWADFHYNDVSMDWEFCIDDLNVEVYGADDVYG